MRDLQEQFQFANLRTTSSRFPPPWTVEEYRGISFIVRDANKFAVGLAGARQLIS
jgi:hypothetical protein